MPRGRALSTALLFVVAIAAAVALALWQRARGENDWGNAGFQQIQHARSVWDGAGFGRTYPFGFHPNLFLRPVYTVVLAPFTAAFQWDAAPFRVGVAVLQGAANAGLGLAVGWVLARAGQERAASVARWACVLDPFLVSQAATIVDTIVFTLLLAGSWALAVRASERRTTGAWALAGLCFGLAVLTRSTALAVLPAAAFRLWETRPAARDAARHAAAFGAAAFLVLVPWFARNHAITDRWMLSTVDGVNVWMGNNEHTARFLDEARSLDELPGREPLDALNAVTVEDQLRAYDASREAASRWMRENRGEALVLAVRKAGLLWTPQAYPRTTRSRIHGLKETVAVVWTLALYAVAACGLALAVRSPSLRPVARDVALTCAAFTVPHAIAWSGTRLRVPLEPFLIVLAAVGVAAALDAARRRRGGG
jgi:hypothetical protein